MIISKIIFGVVCVIYFLLIGYFTNKKNDFSIFVIGSFLSLIVLPILRAFLLLN
ncbi:hypothetical protein [Clostridium sp.]|uniref:hypothetical protein n=1 Tax=Clostridium sp. TaxID=1506 RepID=UPI002603E18D|nr:hypothetical protein [Clostridium sp.]